MKIRAIDTLVTHHTTVGNVYEAMSQDEDCYKVIDDRGKVNWLPKRYFETVEDE